MKHHMVIMKKKKSEIQIYMCPFLHSYWQLYVGILKFPENCTHASFILHSYNVFCKSILMCMHPILFCRIQSLDTNYGEHSQSN